MMSEAQSLNDTSNSSHGSTEIPLPRMARFWLLLPSDILSMACTVFVLFYVLINRKARLHVKNHVLIALLIIGLLVQIIDIPLYINFIVHSGVTPAYPLTCRIWYFTDVGMYNGGLLLMTWLAFERHIIVFHDRWIATRKRRIIVHYLPLLSLILYIFVFYIYFMYFYPCENIYDYTLPVCGLSICYQNNLFLLMWDQVPNYLVPTLLEVIFSFTFLLRVIWQKHRVQQPIQWRRQRKMTIQLISIAILNTAFNVPSAILQIGYFFGMPTYIGASYMPYGYFLGYFVPLIFPLICLLSIVDIKRIFEENMLHRRRTRVIGLAIGVVVNNKITPPI